MRAGAGLPGSEIPRATGETGRDAARTAPPAQRSNELFNQHVKNGSIGNDHTTIHNGLRPRQFTGFCSAPRPRPADKAIGTKALCLGSRGRGTFSQLRRSPRRTFPHRLSFVAAP